MNVQVDDTVRIVATFHAWTSSGELGEIEDPVTVGLDVYDASTSPDTLISTEEPIKQSDGVYYYDWTPDELGEFLIRFVGEFDDDSTDVVSRTFTVVEDTTAGLSTTTLLTDYTFSWAAGLSPLYVNPDELSILFTDATDLEIAEFIFIYSSEMKTMFRLGDDELPNFAIQEYVKAAAACSLSKIYDIDSDEASVTLGDLTVVNRTYAKANVNTGNATTWCELAAALRKQILFDGTGPKWARKADVYVNPISNRKLKRLDTDLILPEESLN